MTSEPAPTKQERLRSSADAYLQMAGFLFSVLALADCWWLVDRTFVLLHGPAGTDWLAIGLQCAWAVAALCMSLFLIGLCKWLRSHP